MLDHVEAVVVEAAVLVAADEVELLRAWELRREGKELLEVDVLQAALGLPGESAELGADRAGDRIIRLSHRVGVVHAESRLRGQARYELQRTREVAEDPVFRRDI